MTLRFTDTDLAKPVTARVKVFDTQVRGLYASKTPNACTFAYRYFDRTAKTGRTVTVGAFHPVEFTVKHARLQARRLDTDVRVHGKDVAGAIRREATIAHAGTRTFGEVADLFIAYLRTVKENWVKDHYSLTRPRTAWAKRAIADVSDEDIHALLTGIVREDKPEQARNTLNVLSQLFRWAGEIGQKYITVNPIAFVTAKSLKLPAGNRKTRYLTDDELRTLWHGLDHPDLPADRSAALCYKLILATALRPSEMGLALRSEIGAISKHQGGDGGPSYRIPAERVKKRRVIVQPLSSLALELIAELQADGRKDGPLFRYGYSKDGKLDAHELGRLLRSQPASEWRKTRRVGICEFLGLAPFTPHDLRRTAATHLGLAEVGNADIARILDHAPAQDAASGGATIHVYNVADHVRQTKRRRPTLDRLGAILREVVGQAPARNVVRLKVA